MEVYTYKTLHVEFNDLPKMPPVPKTNVYAIRMTIEQAERQFPDLMEDLHRMIWSHGVSEHEMSQSLSWGVEIILDYEHNKIEVWTLSM
jgi:hypothetical protein